MVWLRREIVEHAAYHTISVTRGRQPFFADSGNAELVAASIRHASASGKAYVLAYAVLPDHLHLLLVPRGDKTVSGILMDLKRYSAKLINQQLGRRGPLWQQSFFDRLIRGDAQLEATIRYIEHNPVAAGLVNEPEQFFFSSASPTGFNDNQQFWDG